MALTICSLCGASTSMSDSPCRNCGKSYAERMGYSAGYVEAYKSSQNLNDESKKILDDSKKLLDDAKTILTAAEIMENGRRRRY